MSYVKTTISLQETLLQKIGDLARELGVSRSRLFALVAKEFLQRYQNQAGVFPAEDIVSAAFQFESGVQGMGTWCFTAFEALDRTEIMGSHGKIIYATFDDQPITLVTAAGASQFAIDYPEHVQQPLIQTVVDDLNGVGTCPSPGESAARTSWVMDQILLDYRKRLNR